MLFEPDDERRMLADSLRRFIAEQYAIDTRMHVAAMPLGFDPSVWRRFCDLGAVAALFDCAAGGLGGGVDDIRVVFEALGRGLVVEPFLPTLMAGHAIASLGNAAQRGVLDTVIAGGRRVAFAHAEPASGHDPAWVETRASRSADGWVIDGTKSAVQAAEQADFVVVSARTRGAPDDADGLTLFLLPGAVPGLSTRGMVQVDGGRGAELRLDGLAVGPAAVLGPVDGAESTIEACIGRGVFALCAEALGVLDVALAMTLDHLRTRRQFGVPIGSFQALRHRLADIAIDIEQARSAVFNAGFAFGAGRRERERALSAAKLTIGRVGTQAAQEFIQMHGGIGTTWELPLSHFAKRLVLIDHQLGDEDHHLARYIALGQPQSKESTCRTT